MQLNWTTRYLRDLLRELISRDLKLRYKRSFLGILWSLLNPLLQLVILSLIFRIVLPLNIPNYNTFLFTGLLVWTWFQTSLYSATGTIVDNRELIRRPGFPAAILPVVTVATNFIQFLLALPILLIFLLITGFTLSAALVSLPVLFVVQFLFTLSLVYVIATLHVRFRDTQYLLGIALLLGFYISPIFYEASRIPQQYQLLYRLNPMVTLIESYRRVLIHGLFPDLLSLTLLSIISLVLLLIGYRLFKHARAQFAEEL
jgi:lipopolysaccharide transport system permease protein